MNKFAIGLLVGSGIGIGMLICPQVRDFMDKMENKMNKKKKKEQQNAE